MTNLPLPEALILDFGGVLYDIDYEAPVRAFAALGVSDFAGLYQQSAQSPMFDDLECGRISPSNFYAQMQSHCAPETTLAEVAQAWNSILTGMHASRIPLVQALGKQTRLFLLSNTNVIHAHVFEAWMEKRFGLSSFRGAFEGIHYSQEMGQRKPDLEAFLSLCSRHRVDPSRTIFIDDSEQHVKGARAAGLDVHWHHPVEDDVAIWLSKRGFDLPESAFRSGPLPA